MKDKTKNKLIIIVPVSTCLLAALILMSLGLVNADDDLLDYEEALLIYFSPDTENDVITISGNGTVFWVNHSYDNRSYKFEVVSSPCNEWYINRRENVTFPGGGYVDVMLDFMFTWGTCRGG